jgi:hypothetical protein
VIDGIHHPSVTSIGIRPTIGDNQLTLKPHLLDGSRSLCGSGCDWPCAVASRGTEVRRPRALRADVADCDTARALFAAMAL